MTHEQILAALQGFLSHPATQFLLAGLILSGLPNSFLERLPVVGNTVKAFLNAWGRKKLEDFAREQKIIQDEAHRIVAAKEQLIRNGRLDQPSAKAQALLELRKMFTITPDQAERFIESEVYKLDRSLALGEWLPLEPGDAPVRKDVN